MLNQKKHSRKTIIKISKEIISFDERVILKFLQENSDYFYLIKKAQFQRMITNIADLTKLMLILVQVVNFKKNYLIPDMNSIKEWVSNSPKWLRRC